ncbi:WhiB family transcriptional regulator [Rhodococcus pyridinivorans]|uniref:WhiB family transcriptional regulator n=1 Tax=Rhodococcus pyridinivorans TaxID=103816 RepID=UPI0009BD2C9A|nr:WhiB family transcriptional regulator [Rhodococcus pyridinivorans]
MYADENHGRRCNPLFDRFISYVESNDPGPWWDHADCRFFGPALFFGSDDETRGQRAQREQNAKRICRHCPVRLHCLQYALSLGDPYGIWGGTTERERRVPKCREKNELNLFSPMDYKIGSD